MLYESPGRADAFYCRFLVRNDSGSPIGVDLGDGDWDSIRPIQYSGQDIPRMTVIDIMTPVPPELTDSLTAALESSFAAGELVTLDPGESLEFFGMFDGSGMQDIEDLECAWLLLAYSGWLTVTDGTTSEVITPEDGFVYIPVRMPVSWEGLPQ